VNIQSGNKFSVNKFGQENTSEVLQSQAIYLNIACKYMDQCAMASRTLLVNPKPEQIEAYKIAVDALDCLKENLVVDQPICKAYNAARALISDRNKQLSGTSTNFGFGIGFNCKEDSLVINADN
jgi:nucleosome binding factor SPN SPT16 subunit